MMIPMIGLAVILIVCAGVLFFSDGKSPKESESQPTVEGMQAVPSSAPEVKDAPILPVPGLNKRVCGYLIDFLPVAVIQTGAYFLADIKVSWLIFIPYWLLRDSVGGRSLGKRVIGLQASTDQGKPASAIQGMIRNIPVVMPLLSLIEYFMMRFNAEGKRIGDLMAQTRVIDLSPEKEDRKFVLKSLGLGLLGFAIFAGPTLSWGLQRFDIVTEPATDFVNYYERALEAYPSNPELASALALKAEIIGTYDILRVKDPHAGKAWRSVQEDFAEIHQWAALHPRIYRRNMRDVVKWGQRQIEPTYPPLWVGRFGMEAAGIITEGKKIQLGKNPEHNPTRDWKMAVDSVGEFAEDEVSWRDMHQAIKPENIAKTLQESKADILKVYSQALDEATLKEVEGHLQQMIDGYKEKSGTPGDRMMAVTADIRHYLEELDAQILPPDENLAKSVLEAFATASEAYAQENKGVYPPSMDTLVQADPPYVTGNFCGLSDGGYRFMCDMHAKGYRFLAEPVKEGSDLPSYSIKTGRVLEKL